MRTMDHQMDDSWDREPGRGMGRGSYREIEPELPGRMSEPAESEDLTLGIPALLGIFVAVVLVCAVFFGFGYSTGRTLHGTKATAGTPAAAVGDEADGATKTPPLAAVQPAAKPSAGAALADGGANAQTLDEPAGFPPSAVTRRSTAPEAEADEDIAPANAPARSAASSADLPAVRPAAVAPAALSAVGAGALMVQIAAVVHQADADMLARALRANGYAAVVRTEPQDKFLHVQVGPFATRDQAKAMRTRLEAAGYNALIKP